jgi:hypothetical protein
VPTSKDTFDGVRRTPEQSAEDFLKKVVDFKRRTFTGAEVLEIADELGAGVGATIMAELVAAGRRRGTQS